MRTLLALVLFVAALSLGGCSDRGAESTLYAPPESASGRLCAAKCGDKHDICRRNCSLEQRACTNKVQGQALVDYEKYMSEQFLHANAIERRESDFEHLEPCETGFASCATLCEAPYQSCYTDCGGTVKNPSNNVLTFF